VQVLFISNRVGVSLNFFFGRSKPQITETMDTESVDMGARVYYDFMPLSVSTDLFGQ
jgi:hypothetical protein